MQVAVTQAIEMRSLLVVESRQNRKLEDLFRSGVARREIFHRVESVAGSTLLRRDLPTAAKALALYW